jgi:hypothetical protein
MNSYFSVVKRVFLFGGLVGLASFFGGCATASKPAAMTVELGTTAIKKHPHAVALAVSGGEETSSLGMSSISNADFASAIKASIEQSGLFSAVDGESSPYQLAAHITRLDRPSFGTAFTVNLEVSWQLRRLADQVLVWEKAISSSFTAKMGDAFVGTTRLRLANEGAARANIKDAIDQMGQLELP